MSMRVGHFLGGLGAGLFVMLAGIGYFVLSVGVPSQDAPPELQAVENQHANVAEALLVAGLGIVLVTALLGCLRAGAALVARARRR
jgi:hypothetical protein